MMASSMEKTESGECGGRMNRSEQAYDEFGRLGIELRNGAGEHVLSYKASRGEAFRREGLADSERRATCGVRTFSLRYGWKRLAAR
jgi:hypothetical protein